MAIEKTQVSPPPPPDVGGMAQKSLPPSGVLDLLFAVCLVAGLVIVIALVAINQLAQG